MLTLSSTSHENSLLLASLDFITNPGSETTDWVAHSVDDSGDSRTLAWSDTGGFCLTKLSLFFQTVSFYKISY
jgi:hypothetical protein